MRDGVDGFLCRAKDPVDLAEKMEKIILLDAETLKIMGENGRRRMLEEFDERLAINIYSDSICKLLSCGEKEHGGQLIADRDAKHEAYRKVDALLRTECPKPTWGRDSFITTINELKAKLAEAEAAANAIPV